MCSHYQTLKDAELLLKFGAPNAGRWQYDMWPRYPGIFIRRPVEHDAGDEAVPEREALVGRWGMMRGRALLPAGGCSGLLSDGLRPTPDSDPNPVDTSHLARLQMKNTVYLYSTNGLSNNALLLPLLIRRH